MTRKKCSICNTENDEDAVYCIRCSSFLNGTEAPGGGRMQRTSIWETEAGHPCPTALPVGTTATGRVDTGTGKRVMVCPKCGAETPLTDNKIPVFCQSCDYSFQAADKPVPSGQTAGIAKTAAGTIKLEADAAKGQKGGVSSRRPVRKVVPDRSELRIIDISDGKGSFVLPIRERAVIGTQGSLEPARFRAFHSVEPLHLMIWHTDAGWYLRHLKGLTLINGESLNPSQVRRLMDGDLVNAGECVFMVEISRKQQ